MFITKSKVIKNGNNEQNRLDLFGELAGLVGAGHDLVVEDREVEGKAKPGQRVKSHCHQNHWSWDGELLDCHLAKGD